MLPVEHHLHVIPDIWVPVLVDGEAGGGVEKLDVHDSNLGKLNQLIKIDKVGPAGL